MKEKKLGSSLRKTSQHQYILAQERISNGEKLTVTKSTRGQFWIGREIDYMTEVFQFLTVIILCQMQAVHTVYIEKQDDKSILNSVGLKILLAGYWEAILAFMSWHKKVSVMLLFYLRPNGINVKWFVLKH